MLNPFFPLKMVAFLWPTLADNSHSSEQKKKANEGLVKHLPINESMPNSSLNKSNPSQDTKLISWGIKAFSTTKNPVISNTLNSI